MYPTIALSDIQTKFPLKYLLILYCNAHPKDVYCEYFKGFKLLLSWLGGKNLISIQKGKTFKYKTSLRKPRLLPIVSYEVLEIAKLLSLPEDVILMELLNAYVELTLDSDSDSDSETLEKV